MIVVHFDLVSATRQRHDVSPIHEHAVSVLMHWHGEHDLVESIPDVSGQIRNLLDEIFGDMILILDEGLEFRKPCLELLND